MIAKECKELRQQLEAMAKAEANEKLVELLNKKRDELATLRDTVVAAIESLQAISKRTTPVGQPDASKAFERVQNLRAALKENPQSLSKGQDLSLMTRAFGKFAVDANGVTTSTWEQFVQRSRPKIDTNQLAQAEQQDSHKTTVRDIKSKARDADSLGKAAPATEANFTELEAVWEDLRRLLESLPRVTKDPNVLEFLKAANSNKGAALDMLTDEVLVWLKENKSADKYRIFNSK